MLTFESPFYEIDGVVIFRDHAVRTQYHYLCGPPRLSRGPDGKPHLLLLKYAHAIDGSEASPLLREQLGGAFLMFGVDCGVDAGTLSSIRNQLANLHDEEERDGISLVPVLYTSGSVKVVALDHQTAVETESDAANPVTSRFVRGVVGSATPSLMQNQHAIFSISLTPDAATLIEEAYQSDLSPIGVMYELEFAGLRPAIAVKAKVDKRRVYEQFKLGLHVGVGTGPDREEKETTGGTPTPAGGAGSGQPSGQTTTPPSGNGTPAAGETATPPGDATDANASGAGSQPSAEGGESSGSTADAGETGDASGNQTTTDSASGTADGSATAEGSGTTGEGQDSGDGGSAGSESGQQTGSGEGQDSKSKTQVAVSADIDVTLESLKETGAIVIEIVRQQEGQAVAEMERAALQLLKETLLGEFFRPAMTNSPSSAAAAVEAAKSATGLIAGTRETSKGRTGAGTKVEIGFQLKYLRQEELKEATYDYSVTAPEKRTHAPNGFFSALVTDTEKEDHIRSVDLASEFFRTLLVDVTTTEDFETFDLKKVTVDCRHGATAKTLDFGPGDVAPGFFQAFLDGTDASWEYRLKYLFGQQEDIAAPASTYETPWRSTTSRALVVHPAEDVAMLRVIVEPGVVDWEVVDRIETRLAYADPASGFTTERTFLLGETSERQTWIVRLPEGAPPAYSVRNIWHMKEGREIAGTEEVHDERHLFIADPFVDRLELTVHPQVDSNNIRRVHFKVDYEDPGHDFEIHKNVEIEGPEFRPAQVTIPLMDPARRKYTYSVSLVRTTGLAEIHAPKTTDDLSVVVTEGGIYLDVDVVVLGDMTALGISAVQVDLVANPLDGAVETVANHLFLPGPENRVTKRLLLRADQPQRFRYRTMVFKPEGQVTRDWTEHTGSILPLQLQTLVAG